jgi:MFS family permease
MKFFHRHRLFSWLPRLNSQVWILGVGRLLSEVGTGFTLFYAPIFFVNQVGFSATTVGLALGSASISGVLGRILGGSFSDSQFWGRRRTLLLSAAIAAIASFVLAATNNFSTLVVGNLLMGLGQGLYWPANEAVVADVTEPEQRQEAYALTRLADNLGMGMGIVFGGALIGITGAYRALFVIDAISFLVFFAVVYFAIKETYRPQADRSSASLRASWATALGDRRFLVYILVNIIFTIYVSQLQSALPLYLKNFVPGGNQGKGFSETTISVLFGWHLSIAILCQLPVARALKRLSHAQALAVSASIWAIGFICIWVTGIASTGQLGWAILALGLLAIAIVSYTPSASSLVTDLAPESQRGVYFSISSLCWAIGYFIGPPLGGWALDQSPQVADSFWLGMAGSVVVTIAILQYLQRMLCHK